MRYTRVSNVKLETLIRGRSGAIEIKGSRFRYLREDGQLREGEFLRQQLDAGLSAVMIDGNVYRISSGAPGEVLVNGVPLPVELFDPRALSSRKGAVSAQGRVEVAARMPGKVVRLLASAGDPVETGQGLVVVEAMKMQNEVKSPKSGQVIEVRVQPGATVIAGEVLAVVE